MTDLDIDSILDSADFATEEVPICLKGSLLSEWGRVDAEVEAANADLAAAREAKSSTSEAAARAAEAMSRLSEVEERMRANSLTFVLTGIAQHEYNDIILRNPPRLDDAGNMVMSDRAYGFDTARTFPALVQRCTTSPAMTDAQWSKLIAKLTDRQWDALVGAVIRLNRGTDGSIPFSWAGSEVTRTLSEMSTVPSSSGSAPSDSGAGSPRRPTRAGPKRSGTKSNAT